MTLSVSLTRNVEEGKELLFTDLSALPEADTYWLRYKEQQELSPEEAMNFLSLTVDMLEGRKVVYLDPAFVSKQLNIPGETLLSGFPEKFVSLIQKTAWISRELYRAIDVVKVQDPKHFVQKGDILHLAPWLALVFLYHRVPNQTKRLSAKDYHLPVGITISIKGRIFLDIKKSTFSLPPADVSHRGRKWKKAYWLGGEEGIVAKGVAPLSWKTEADLKALRIFNNCHGVIKTYAFYTYPEKGKYIVYQQLYDTDFFETLRKKMVFSMQDQLDLTHDWLSGLTCFPPATHTDIRAENLLLRRRFSDGKIEGVITDFDHVCFPDDQARQAKGFPPVREMPPEKEITPAGDIWQMGANLYVLFSKRLLPWCYHPETTWPPWIRSLEHGWPDFPSFVPSPIQALLTCMLHPNPKSRPTGQQVLQIYEKFLAINKTGPLKPLLISSSSDEDRSSPAKKPLDPPLSSPDGRVCEIE